MAENTGKPKTKKPAKGMATHVRRMKQEARKAGMVYRPEITSYVS